MKPTGGPAFPANTLNVPFAEADHPHYQGMTLRDWFASQALAFIRSSGTNEGLAQACYAIADAMLAEREKQG